MLCLLGDSFRSLAAVSRCEPGENPSEKDLNGSPVGRRNAVTKRFQHSAAAVLLAVLLIFLEKHIMILTPTGIPGAGSPSKDRFSLTSQSFPLPLALL